MTWEQLIKIVGGTLAALAALVSLTAYLIRRWVKSVKKNTGGQLERRAPGGRRPGQNG